MFILVEPDTFRECQSAPPSTEAEVNGRRRGTGTLCEADKDCDVLRGGLDKVGSERALP